MRLDTVTVGKALRLSSPESAALKALSGAPEGLRVSPLARSAALPRTTALAALRNLRTRGLVERGSGTWPLWRIASDETVARRLRLERSDQTEDFASGAASVARAVASLPVGSRIFAIQGRALRRQMEVLPGSFLERYHAALKRRKIVIEGVASEATLRALLSLDEAALESHYGRPVVAYVVPAEFLDFDADYLVLPNGRVFAFDWVTPSVSAIRSQAVADSIRAWLGLLVRHGKKTDINAAIRDRLTKRA